MDGALARNSKAKGLYFGQLRFSGLNSRCYKSWERKALLITIRKLDKYFWPTIIRNIEEAKEIIDYAVDNLADKDRIGVIGHSEALPLGSLPTISEVKTAVILNGSYNWQGANEIFGGLGVESTSDFQEEEKIDSLTL